MRFSWPYDQTKESKEIVFEGVAGYQFRDAVGSVIFEIQERDLEGFLKEHEYEFLDGYRRIGFPQFWRGDIPATMAELKGMKIWEISSSVGFEGYVVARSVSEADQGEACNAEKPSRVKRKS